MTLLVVFGTLAGFFFLAERIRPLRRQPVWRRGIVADLMYVPIQYLMRVAVSFTAAAVLTEAGHRLLPDRVGLLAGRSVWIQVVVVVVVLDFLFYVMHVLKHRWQWWWRLHETHHSSEALDFLASVRFHPLEKLLDRLVFLLPLTVLGADQTALLIWSAMDVFFGMLNHSNVRWRLGRPLIYVFVGPEMHLWHHARDRTRRDVNFGNNLSIFDWIFGTASVPEGRPTEFGIDDGPYPQENVLRQFLFAFRPSLPTLPESREHRAQARNEGR